MQLAQVIGHATATVKHHSLNGWRMLVVQPLGVNDSLDGDPVIAVDPFNSRIGDRVILVSDGSSIRKMMNANDSPVRWASLGIADS
ncbi:MAG: hypothetical protein Tsb009_18370 [Planctomycetaceae bacterium]